MEPLEFNLELQFNFQWRIETLNAFSITLYDIQNTSTKQSGKSSETTYKIISSLERIGILGDKLGRRKPRNDLERLNFELRLFRFLF